jgi:hypothetical protein
VVGFDAKARLAPTHATRQKHFEHVLHTTDLSEVSVTALQNAAGISHDHEEQLNALYVESDPEKGFSFDRPLPDLWLQEWLQNRIDGLAAVALCRSAWIGRGFGICKRVFLAVLLMKRFVRQGARP